MYAVYKKIFIKKGASSKIRVIAVWNNIDFEIIGKVNNLNDILS